MFPLVIHSVFEKIVQFDVCDVSFTSGRGEHTILPNHEPFFTSILPEAVYFTTTSESLSGVPDKNEKKEREKVLLKEAGFLRFDGQRCDVWIL
ncbi:MAG: hypothetical protein LBF84_03745 [Holosporales bacterium]|jgi:F0F1-type ATP synthase epsilon subunit|nr:hypothetical protein [Holosporales bacterium]